MKKLAGLILLAVSLPAIGCSSDQSANRNAPDSKPVKLEPDKANATLNRWVLSEEKKASELMKMGDTTKGGIDRIRVLIVNENGNTAEASFNFQTMSTFLEDKTVKLVSGSGKATFEWKNGRWYLMKVANPQADFVRDNLLVEVK